MEADLFLNFLELKVRENQKTWVRRTSFQIDPKISGLNKNIMKEKFKIAKEKYGATKKTRRNLDLFYVIDPELANCTIKQLLDKIKIEHLVEFIQFTQIYFCKKYSDSKNEDYDSDEDLYKSIFKNNKPHKLNKKGPNSPIQRKILINPQIFQKEFENPPDLTQNIQITVSKFEIEEILLAKAKRFDECYKQAFRAIKTALQKPKIGGKLKKRSLEQFLNPNTDWENSIWINKKKNNNSAKKNDTNQKKNRGTRTKKKKRRRSKSRSPVKKSDNIDISNQKTVKKKTKAPSSTENNISKKNILKAKKHTRIMKMANEYICKKFLVEGVKSKIMNKHEEFFFPKNKGDFDYKFFLRKLLTNDKKFSPNCQMILNSLWLFLDINESSADQNSESGELMVPSPSSLKRLKKQ